jgi:glycosyltransferase involved in cell wall biosynthesis
MKILYLLDFNINTLGGSQKSTKTIIEEMKKNGYEVGLFMPDGEEYVNDGVYVYSYNNNSNCKIYKFYNKIYNLKKCINSFNPDIVHPQNPEIAALLLISLKMKIIDKKRKYIFTDRHYYTEYSKKYKFIWKQLSYQFNGIITTTENNLNEWIKYVKPKKIKCIKNVLDKKWFEYYDNMEKELKIKYECSNTINIGFSGRYVKYKRWDTAFEICKLLNDGNHKFIFTLVSDENNKEEMKKYIKELNENLKENVIVFENANFKKMEEFYYILDAFVLTSDSESFGRTILEAMTKNNIVFGTNSGGVPNILPSEYLFEVGNAIQIVDMINNFFADYKELHKQKKYFRKYVKNNYSSQILGEELTNFYKEILDD